MQGGLMVQGRIDDMVGLNCNVDEKSTFGVHSIILSSSLLLGSYSSPRYNVNKVSLVKQQAQILLAGYLIH